MSQPDLLQIIRNKNQDKLIDFIMLEDLTVEERILGIRETEDLNIVWLLSESFDLQFSSLSSDVLYKIYRAHMKY